MILSYLPFTKDVARLFFKMRSEFGIISGDRGALQILCYMKRFQTFKYLLTLCELDQILLNELYVQMIQTHKGFTLFDSLQAKADPLKCEIKPDDEMNMRKVLTRLLPHAIQALSSNTKHQQQINAFKTAYKQIIPFVTHELVLKEFYEGVLVEKEEAEQEAEQNEDDCIDL
ncbi:Conserved_hypothetical protein [Hexamita inflata]|uniref:Uncharacterized protein n=1 Tax=Hexamita inflata TaxID=28002 RepID=A0AA86Q566_9EUKA|nr:Conserved hypothetical protein [Hexamita inflata]